MSYPSGHGKTLLRLKFYGSVFQVDQEFPVNNVSGK
jgi:hypothetical protein